MRTFLSFSNTLADRQIIETSTLILDIKITFEMRDFMWHISYIEIPSTYMHIYTLYMSCMYGQYTNLTYVENLLIFKVSCFISCGLYLLLFHFSNHISPYIILYYIYRKKKNVEKMNGLRVKCFHLRFT